LEKAGIVTRKSYAEVPPRVEYTLTSMGWDLIPLIDHMRDYGTKWLRDGGPEAGTSSDDDTAGA
jgi:DNA-binding HxlR family transcriptional regulator